MAKRPTWAVFASLVSVTATACAPSGDPGWATLGPEVDRSLHGVWENTATGHVVSFSSAGRVVFHVLPDFCIRDTGVVPEYSLFRLEGGGAELQLHYYDYRDRPELLQAPQVFQRRETLPPACTSPTEGPLEPTAVYGLVIETFDRFYAFFDERDLDWTAQKQSLATRAAAVPDDSTAFDLLAALLAPLNDGHVNLSGAGRSFNAGRPALRRRLGDAWAAAQTGLSEGEFVSEWHQSVLGSVHPLLDEASLRAGASGAVEWGTIGGTAGYIRINRFSSFSQGEETRPAQYDTLDATLRKALDDLMHAERLIVDVALNGGGSDAAAHLVASYFADRGRDVLSYEVLGSPTQTIRVTPAGAGETRPVALITSEVTASAAESFVLMMRAFPHVTHMGGTTRGGLSSLLPKPFPNGFQATLSYQRVLDSEGRLFEATGIPPHREIELVPQSDVRGTFARVLEEIARGW